MTTLIVTNGPIYTSDPERPWAEAFSVEDGRIGTVGTLDEVRSSVTADAGVVDLNGRFAMPGLVDVHAHLGLGGRQLAFELQVLPSDDVAAIAAKVRQWRAELEPGQWVVGGIVGSTVMDDLTHQDLLTLDDAAEGHPVLLRDDTMHNRWVNSAAFEILGITEGSPNPEGGTYVRDSDGLLNGVLTELACSAAEAAVLESIGDVANFHARAIGTAVQTLNSFGVTAVQESATMDYALTTLRVLDEAGELTAHVVASMPAQPFLEEGITGEELYRVGDANHTAHLHPTFAKYVLDGVPMTRTAALLTPYQCHHPGDDPTFTGEPLWGREELVASLLSLADRGLSAKLHATGDGAVRLILDAVETVRRERGWKTKFHIAHVEYVHDDDLARFAELQVVPDASPYLWFPSVMQESMAKQVSAETFERSWPLRRLIDSGAQVSCGSDWPCAAPTPDPWTGLATLITRANPDPAVTGELNPGEALSVEQAISAFTRNPAHAMGLGEVTGMLRPGMSADFIVLDRNLFSADPAHLHETTVLTTYFEGRLVHQT
ncbi:amidohydrolase [Brevibacterium aurantiacum]|uniref:Amidohydrolase n=1 Tax=Brevibacterium aurantiacum TaxID=273384 RepID=A0A556CHW4_BREAU|nr:amidohydrolase [Brevibacterium aurantiacum]TSI17019.1 amidohydrolase [Brevibacterium aurantiacum]